MYLGISNYNKRRKQCFYKKIGIGVAVILAFVGIFAMAKPGGEAPDKLPSDTQMQQPPAEPQAPLTPPPTEIAENSHLVAESEALGEEYFENVAFIGNSLTEGITLYGYAKKADIFANRGLMISDVLTKPKITGANGEKTTVFAEINKKQYKAIYILLGTNELGWAYDHLFKEEYGKVLDALKESQPEAKIYVQSNFPITEKKSSSGDIYTNDKINNYNRLLEELAEEKDVYYLNVREAVEDDKGILPVEGSTDGFHMQKPYVEKWIAYIKTHVAK